MIVRPALPDEFDAVGDLCVAAYAPFLDGGGRYVEQLRDVARRAAYASVLVAVDGSRLVGTVTFVPDGGPLGEIAGEDETEFRMLAVDPAFQGRGVGAALLEDVISRSTGHGAIVCSSLPVMRAAHRLYARLGFARAPSRDWAPVAGVRLLAFVLPLR